MNPAIHNDKAVKPVLDPKGPLKGKGGSLAQWRSEAMDRLARMHSDMSMLAAESKRVEGRRWSLNVYRLRDGRQLRWRLTDGRHATWSSIAPLLVTLPAGLVRWYGQVEQAAQILNHREQAIRYEIKAIERLLNRTSPTTPKSTSQRT